jgi:SAM-dependent methyltransferase
VNSVSKDIRTLVSERYGAAARSGPDSGHEGARRIARAFGYSEEDLAAVPAGANMGLSCGNPVALAGLRPGEVVVDLGCGGGLDVLLAAAKVAPGGMAVGIDMTPDMLARARTNAKKAGVRNVAFHEAPIEALPLDDGSVDCVISNCVLNLVADKDRAFAEIFRVLRPGGRLAVSDIVLRRELPPDLACSAEAWVGCIAGALPAAQFERDLIAAGFSDVQLVDSGADLNVYGEIEGQSACCAPAAPQPASGGGCCGPAKNAGTADMSVHKGLADVMRRYDLNAYAASMKIFALKPSP